MKKVLVKTKIVLEDNGTSLVIYFWKKTFLFFGYWYPFGCSSGTKIPDEKIKRINDNTLSKVIFENIIRTKEDNASPSLSDIIHRLSSLTRRDIDKYKSTPTKEVLEYSNYKHGRFVLWSDVDRLISELNKK